MPTEDVAKLFAPVVHPATLAADEHAADALACPACGEHGIPFWRVWAFGTMIGQSCSRCGARLRVHKTGLLRFAGYPIGGLLGAMLMANVQTPWLSWWSFAAAAAVGLALDAWCDSRVVHFSLRSAAHR